MSRVLIQMIVLIPVVIVIVTAIFQWLWNITMPQVFEFKKITFWQALRILLLAGFLFGAGNVIKFNHQVNQTVRPSGTTVTFP